MNPGEGLSLRRAQSSFFAFLAARVQLVVTTSELTAIQNAYGFIKCASMRAKALERARPTAAADIASHIVALIDRQKPRR